MRIWKSVAGAAALAFVMAADAHAASVGSVVLSKLVEKLPAGLQYAQIQDGIFCVTKRRLVGDGAIKPVNMDVYGPIFARVMATSSNASKEERPNLFDTNEKETGGKPVYEIGGLVHHMNFKFCAVTDGRTDFGAKGGGTMQIQWQIYSPAKREVVATIETSGAYEIGQRISRSDVIELAMEGAFAANVQQLAESAQYRAILDAPLPVDELRSRPGEQARIPAKAGAPAPRSAAEAVGAVVLILLPNGHGSGVLISDEGYVLTNAHVVGERKTVKVRWSDGLETDGEVVRLHEGRDVALVKTDPRGRTPLSTRYTALQPGDAVMAIGAPLDMEMQGTVTKGIVSANRVLDGYSWIQSDVAVNPGNSGGALIDEKGMLIGLTDKGLMTDVGAPAGLNLFIPIKDALDFLSIDLAIAPAPPAKSASAPAAGRSSAR